MMGAKVNHFAMRKNITPSIVTGYTNIVTDCRL